jgi:SWI/SNF-related matrix-associated actin-dependent regulator 1 of chromatin subfamily A
VAVKSGPYGEETRGAVDSAWLVERVLGGPRQKPHIWPGVPGAADRARTYAAWARPFGDKPLVARTYQQDGAAFLAERDYAVLSDAPGLGKTCQALCAAEGRLSLAAVPTPTTPAVLILAPALAKRHWQREVRRWTGYEAAVLDGLRAEELPPARYVIANYDILFGARRKDPAGVVSERADLPGWGKLLAAVGFVIVICDELHVLRGRTSRKAQAVRQVTKGIPVVWGLTGTLMPNYVRDLWGQLDLITSGLFGSYWPWVKKYCSGYQGEHGWVDTGASDLDELSRRLAFFVVGRTSASVKLELPPMQREKYPIDVEVTASERHIGVEAKDRHKAVGNALRVTARAKRPAVVEHAVEALSARQKVVVFLYMRDQCDAVAAEIKAKSDATVIAVHGDMTPEGRDKMATTFRETTGACAFVATIDSVGMAISLVGADLVLFGDLVPEPWKMYQAELRCYRFDSVKSVLIRYLLATGTLDEHYAESVIAKVENIEAVMGQGGDQGALATTFGARSSEEIVEGLFAKLAAMGGDA